LLFEVCHDLETLENEAFCFVSIAILQAD
jgi:hypothetical protein